MMARPRSGRGPRTWAGALPRGRLPGRGLTGHVQAAGLGCMAGSAGFVGRERELSRLHAALSGDTRLVLVVGDAGVGKTRFAGEAPAGPQPQAWSHNMGELPAAGREAAVAA